MEELKLNHIGLTINDFDDIQNFYINILGFKKIREFNISSDIAKKIFDVEKEILIVVLNNNYLTIELFCFGKSEPKYFSHICFNVKNRNEFIEKIKRTKYHYFIIPRGNYDLLFIKDNSNNLFEIKEME